MTQNDTCRCFFGENKRKAAEE